MKKIVKGTPRYFSQKGKLDKFTYLMLNFPFECNFQCLKCFSLVQKMPVMEKRLISLAERIMLIEETKDLGGKTVVLAGEGEPSLNSDIKEIVLKINSLDMIPIVYSNGSLLTKDLIEFYKNNNVTMVLNLDSLSEKVYSQLTKTEGQFKRVMKNIENLRKAYATTIEERDKVRTVRIAINATISSVNREEIARIKEFCGDDVYFICNPLAHLGNAQENWEKLVKKDEEIESWQKLAKNLSESGGPLTLGSDGLCGYSAWGIGVSPFGDYMSCAYTKETDGLLDNIQNKSLKEAFEYKHKMEFGHYLSYAFFEKPPPCLVRMPSFDKYLFWLRARLGK